MVNLVRLDIDKKGRILPADKKTGDLQDQAKLRSVAINPAGTLAAVGCKEGSIRVSNRVTNPPADRPDKQATQTADHSQEEEEMD